MTSLVTVGDDNIKAESATIPRGKRSKEELSINLKLADNGDLTPTGPADRQGKGNVFTRLTVKRSNSMKAKKKVEKKEVVINFFDKQYKPAIKGIFLYIRKMY